MKQKGAMMWVVVFILFMIFFYSNNSKKIKKLENKIKKLERKEKGNIEMSRNDWKETNYNGSVYWTR